VLSVPLLSMMLLFLLLLFLFCLSPTSAARDGCHYQLLRMRHSSSLPAAREVATTSPVPGATAAKKLHVARLSQHGYAERVKRIEPVIVPTDRVVTMKQTVHSPTQRRLIAALLSATAANNKEHKPTTSLIAVRNDPACREKERRTTAFASMKTASFSSCRKKTAVLH